MILIKLNKRLLVVAVVGAALILGVAMIVSLKGDDKPAINVNPPPANDEPVDDAPVTPADDDEQAPDDDDATDEPEEPGDDDTGPGDDDDTPEGAKAKGLARAAQVHERNMERMSEKGKTVPQGLMQSSQSLTEKCAALQAEEADDKDNNGNHKGWGQSGKA